MIRTADFYIEKLKLQKHPEGGAFAEIYRSEESVSPDALPARFGGERAFSTSIYFLLNKNEISAFHRIKSDEIWHFYDGTAALIHIIDESGKLTTLHLGRGIELGESFQAVAPKNCWFAAEVFDKKSFALVGCTVSPGFDFNDFELADRDELSKAYPEHKELIERLTLKHS